ncbi:TPA: hypothetical protein DIV55_00955 [Patescibacteria group bacterium]|uniref:Glucosamine-6-phosphate deaminase n=1 Tax=Candidatus Gottesmanbacteria bacterium GW2011_GWA1_43_11 TaxID=1618436 RepID=A0A0G1CH91_9BACT|nr:MAG: Glucosamine-6-phosphate deaminase [Candidatus Gottesmanbacteria bacterium GW2011_GWA1_43_11]HCS78292.1 hypothetical protein [Patescibacteria group bacterium]
MRATLEVYKEQFPIIPVEPLRHLSHPDIKDIRIFADESSTAWAAGTHIITQVLSKPDSHIIYATGKTMEQVYTFVAQQVALGSVSFSRTSAGHLDEYVNANPLHPESFAGYILGRVIRPFHIKPENAFLINGNALDPIVEAFRYNIVMKQKQTDLVILGVGPYPGAHIGFNESGTSFSDQTHVALLDPITVQRDRDRGGEGFSEAITQGPANIFAARDIMLIAYGAGKGLALRQALTGEISESCVASGLRLPGVGSKVTLFIDKAAAEVITA